MYGRTAYGRVAYGRSTTYIAPDVSGYRYWRVRAPTTHSSGLMAAAEVEFRATVGGADQSTGKTATASADFGNPYLPSSAIDNNASTFWTTGGAAAPAGGHWLQVDFGTPVEVAQISYTTRNDSFREDPSSLIVEYSSDGSNWTTAADHQSIAAWSAGETRLFAVPSNAFAPTISGGLQSAGSGVSVKVKQFAPAGGLQSGGTAALAKRIVKTASVSGGLQSGGASATSKSGVVVKTFAPSGGFQSGGAVNGIRTRQFAASGGLSSGGAATLARLVVRSYAVSGGFQSGGAAALARRVVRSVTVSGGFQSGGTAPKSRTENVAPVGGFQSGGAAAVAKTRVFVASGILQSGGAAAVAKIRRAAVSGGFQTGGSVVAVRAKVPEIAGGFQTGGVAETSRLAVKTYEASGGFQSGGTGDASRQIVKSFTGSGALQSGGAALVSHTEDVEAVGGLQSGGSAIVSRTWKAFVFGGLQSGGSSVASLGIGYKGSGGATFGGAAQSARSRALTGTGGLQAGGAAQKSRAFALVISGGFAFGGQGNYSLVEPQPLYEYQGSGSASFSGYASVVFVSAAAPHPGAWSPAYWPEELPKRRKPKAYSYVGQGGLVWGGTAKTRFVLSELSAWEFAGEGLMRIGGSAAVERDDIYAQARAEDEDLMLVIG